MLPLLHTILMMLGTGLAVFIALAGWCWVNAIAKRSRSECLIAGHSEDDCCHCLMNDSCHPNRHSHTGNSAP